MYKVIENLILNSKKAYKESIVIDNSKLEDILLDILTDTKKLEEMLNNKPQEIKETNIKSKKKRYTYEQVKAITKIQVQLAKEEIGLETANRKIFEVANHFPVHNLVQYNKHMKDRLNGIGTYGMAMSANWAKALLEVTNNAPMIIRAVKEQQRLYREKDGRVNLTLEKLLNEL